MPWKLVTNRYTSAWGTLKTTVSTCVTNGADEMPWVASAQREFVDARRMLDAARA
jgi:hypothetical protein